MIYKNCECGKFAFNEVVDRVTGQVVKVCCNDCLRKIDEHKYLVRLRNWEVEDSE